MDLDKSLAVMRGPGVAPAHFQDQHQGLYCTYLSRLPLTLSSKAVTIDYYCGRLVDEILLDIYTVSCKLPMRL